MGAKLAAILTAIVTSKLIVNQQVNCYSTALSVFIAAILIAVAVIDNSIQRVFFVCLATAK